MEKRDFEKIDKEAAPEWKRKMHEIIFEADTPKGKLFDVVLLWAILASVIAVMLETVDSIKTAHTDFLIILEWVFTILFSIEYVLRLISINKPWKYVTSFMGVVDLLSTIPTYISLFVAGPQYLLVIRTIRLLRVFRILKLNRYMIASNSLTEAFKASRHKIIVFLGVITTLVFILGAVMYLVEGQENGFTSIPRSVYWAVVTITTVGYVDIVPHTVLGQIISSFLMISGYGIIAVPTGLVSAEMVGQKMSEFEKTKKSCPECETKNVDENAKFCHNCGHKQ